MSEGDWVEGAPQWWWKYVFPSRTKFWLSMLSSNLERMGPHPDPWFELASAEILEALSMLSASVTLRDDAASTRLKSEAVDKIHEAIQQVR